MCKAYIIIANKKIKIMSRSKQTAMFAISSLLTILLLVLYFISYSVQVIDARNLLLRVVYDAHSEKYEL